MKRAMVCLYKCINQGNPIVEKSVELKNLDNLAVKKLVVIIRRLLDIITVKIHNNFLLGGIKAKKI